MVKKIVMVVDDEPINVKVVKDILESSGFKVVTAINGQEALEKLQKVKPNLVLVDYFMPGLNGLDLCKKIREDRNLRSLKLAFLTVARFSGTQELNKLNILDYIRKPFDTEYLVERVKRITG